MASNDIERIEIRDWPVLPGFIIVGVLEDTAEAGIWCSGFDYDPRTKRLVLTIEDVEDKRAEVEP